MNTVTIRNAQLNRFKEISRNNYGLNDSGIP